MNKKLTITVFTVFVIGFVFKSYAESAPTIEDRARLGEVYSLERLKEFKKAIPMIEDLSQRYGDNREIQWSYVRIFGFGGRWREATKVFNHLCSTDKCDEEDILTYAHILEAQGPNPDTLIFIKELADRHPHHKKIQSIYKEILSWNVQIPKGQGTIDALRLKYPDDLKIAKAYADTLVEQKKYKEAMAQMDRLLLRNPHDKNLQYQHAEIVAAAGDHQQAVRELKALIKDGFTNKEAYVMLGDQLRLLGRNEEALKIYEGVINEK